MCGIAGYIGVKPINKDVIHSMLEGIESRGGHSWGYATSDTFFKQIGKVPSFQKDLNFETRLPKDCNLVIMHSRWATHGQASDIACAHPFVSARWAIVHNGIIDNRHNSMKTQCDSEAILKILIECNDIKKVAEQLRGMFRVAIIDKELKRLHIINDHSPIWMGRTNLTNFYFASESKHLPKFCWIKEAEQMSILTLEVKDGKLISTQEKFKKAETYSQQIGFRHYNYDEWPHVSICNPNQQIIPVPPSTTRGQYLYEVCKQCDKPSCHGCFIIE